MRIAVLTKKARTGVISGAVAALASAEPRIGVLTDTRRQNHAINRNYYQHQLVSQVRADDAGVVRP